MRASVRARALTRRAALLCSISIAAGCAGGTAPPLREQRASWQRAEATADGAAAQAEPFASASVLTRDALVRAVLERNPTIGAARHAWAAALERAPQAGALDDPMLGVSVGPRSFGDSELDPGVRVDVSQRFPFPGKRSLRSEVALAEAEAAGRDYEAVRLRLALLASRLFDEYALTRRAEALNARHLELLDQLKRTAAARYEAGEGSQQDPLEAELEQAEALHRGVLLETRMAVASDQLRALLHAPDAVLPPPADALALPEDPDGDAQAWEQAALDARPELAAAGARVRAGRAAVSLAQREFLPDVTLNGAYDRFWQEEELQPSVGVALEVPLQLGRRRAALSEARAELARAESEAAAGTDALRADVRSAARRLAESRHLLHLIEERQLPAARDRAAAVRTGFETGGSGFSELVEAERGVLGIELEREEARADVCRRRAELDRALGRVAGVEWGGEMR
jgi:outer membrane protein, heavy metal efflux system